MKAEMKQAMASLGLTPSEEEISTLFDRFDTDRSVSDSYSRWLPPLS